MNIVNLSIYIMYPFYSTGKEKLAEYLKISPDSAKAIMASFFGITILI